MDTDVDTDTHRSLGNAKLHAAFLAAAIWLAN